MSIFEVSAAVSNPLLGAALWPSALQTARAILYFRGINAGIQAGAGAAAFIGALV
jgi:hypothetical protein